MCRLFNEGNYHRRLLSGELQASIEHERPSTIVSPTIPPGSVSREVFYFEGQALVAVVQNFITTKGKIAASGKADPKKLFIKGKAYRIRKKSDPNRSRLENWEINEILEKSGFDAMLTYPRGWWDWLKSFWYNTILRHNDY